MNADWLTTLSAIRRGEPSWRAIAAYEGPVGRYLARRWATIPAAERDDLRQEVLLAMRERIVPAYKARVGPFRAFLGTAIDNRARDRLRRRRPESSLDALPGEPAGPPSEAELDALDLEAALVEAVQAVHDRHGGGPEQDEALLETLQGVLVEGLSNAQLAARSGRSVDQVKRLLQRARGELLERLLLGLLPPLTPAPEVARAADLVRACLREPRKATRLLEREASPAVREAADQLVQRLRAAASDLDTAGIVRGIEAVFVQE